MPHPGFDGGVRDLLPAAAAGGLGLGYGAGKEAVE